MTKGEKDYSQSQQGGVSRDRQIPSGGNCMSVTQTHWVIDLLSQNKSNEQKFFESSFQKAQFLQVCLSVSTCCQYYFKGFPLKAVSTLNQIASWKRETVCLPVTLPATCPRAESEQHLYLKIPLPGFSFPCCCFSFAPMTVQPRLWEPACGLYCCVTGAAQTWVHILPPLAADRSLNFSAPQFNWNGNLPFFEWLLLNNWGHIPAHCSLAPCTQVSGKCYFPSQPGKCLYTELQKNEQFI